MRQFIQLTDSEMRLYAETWLEHKAKFDTGPTIAEQAAFRIALITALDYRQAEIAALQAENERLREALQQIADGNPAPPGKWLSDIEMAKIARRALDPIT